MPKTTTSLTGQWQFKEYPTTARRMRDLDTGGWLPTRVPSSIYTSLINAGQIDRRQLDTYPEQFAWVSQKPWVYKKTFQAPPDILDCDRIDLVCDGLDTIASIWLNDKLIAKTNNMFIGHRFDVTAVLKPGQNTLLVKFSPVLEHAQRLMRRYGQINESMPENPCRVYIRKAQYQFGWDFCPSLPGCGISRPLRLEAIDAGRIQDVHIRTIDCNDHWADVRIGVKIEHVKDIELNCNLTLSGGGLNINQPIDFHPHDDYQSAVIRIDRPILWWPKGCGVQHLYKLDVQLTDDRRTIDQTSKNFGVRTIHLDRSKDAQGENFRFEINNRPIYAKGANWVGPSLFAGSVSAADYESLLTRAANANINMLRVWGGGYYENDEFYELCDRLGIMVWQDFMFACAYYPDRKWFLDAVKREATAVIKRLRNHPCVVLWCGNNEIDWLHSTGKLGKGRKFYGKQIYHKTIPTLLSELDPGRDYIPTTPISATKDHNHPKSGTIHQWSVWSGYASPREYLDAEALPRFVTEFGFQSVPEVETVKSFCPKEHLRMGSDILEKHNYQLDGNSRLARYLADTFGSAKDLAEFSYLTQLTQAREVKKYVEYLRANNHYNNGALFWQFNDCAPAISWSAIDYAKRAKALYYYARRFFAPVLVTVTGDYSCDPGRRQSTLRSGSVVVINDSTAPLTADLTCQLMDLYGGLTDRSDFTVAVGPQTVSTAIKLPKEIAQPQQPHKSLLRVSLTDQHGCIAENIFMYAPDKYIQWPDARIDTELIQVTDNTYKLTLSSETIVKDVQLTIASNFQDRTEAQKNKPVPQAHLSDNFVDLLPAGNKEIIIDFEHDAELMQEAIRIQTVNGAV